MKTSRLDQNSEENDETDLPKEEFNEELYSIDQMKTFYIQDWNLSKDWIESPKRLKASMKQQLNNKTSSKNTVLTTRSSSLPSLSSIQLPLLHPIHKQSNQSKQSVLKMFEPFQNSQILMSKMIDFEQNPDTRMIKRRIQIEKKIINHINQEIHKVRQHERKHFQRDQTCQKEIIQNGKISFEDKFNSLNSNTRRILDLQSQKINLPRSSTLVEGKSKINSKKCSIVQILKKYEKTRQLNIQEQIVKLRTKQAEGRRNLIKEMAKQTSSLHSQFSNHLKIQKSKEKIKLSLQKPNHIQNKNC